MMILNVGRSMGSSGTPSITLTPPTFRVLRYSARGCLALTVSMMPSKLVAMACIKPTSQQDK